MTAAERHTTARGLGRSVHSVLVGEDRAQRQLGQRASSTQRSRTGGTSPRWSGRRRGRHDGRDDQNAQALDNYTEITSVAAPVGAGHLVPTGRSAGVRRDDVPTAGPVGACRPCSHGYRNAARATRHTVRRRTRRGGRRSRPGPCRPSRPGPRGPDPSRPRRRRCGRTRPRPHRGPPASTCGSRLQRPAGPWSRAVGLARSPCGGVVRPGIPGSSWAESVGGKVRQSPFRPRCRRPR